MQNKTVDESMIFEDIGFANKYKGTQSIMNKIEGKPVTVCITMYHPKFIYLSVSISLLV